MGNLKLTDSEVDGMVTLLNALSDTKFPQVK
jgi:hypothetical protein